MTCNRPTRAKWWPRRAALSPAHEDDAPDDGVLEVDGGLQALRGLLHHLRSGIQPAPYDVGSLRLFAQEVLALVRPPTSVGQ